MKNTEQKQMRAINRAFKTGIWKNKPIRFALIWDDTRLLIEHSLNTGKPAGYIALFKDRTMHGFMPLTPNTEKVVRLVFEEGAAFNLFSSVDGTRSVVVPDELSLLEARNLMYDVLGCKETEKDLDWKWWFRARAEMADLEEQRAMLDGMTRHLHMAAAMGLKKLVIDLLDSGAQLEEEIGRGNDATPLEIAAWHAFDPLPMVSLLLERGATMTDRAIDCLVRRGFTLQEVNEAMKMGDECPNGVVSH